MNQLKFASALLLASQANAWWGTGHLLTARVAYDQLIADAPEVLQMVEQKLSVIAMFIGSEKDHPFVEAATFADFIKNSGF